MPFYEMDPFIICGSHGTMSFSIFQSNALLSNVPAKQTHSLYGVNIFIIIIITFFLPSFAEKAISFFFILFAILLFSRDPKFVKGWSIFFKKE